MVPMHVALALALAAHGELKEDKDHFNGFAIGTQGWGRGDNPAIHQIQSSYWKSVPENPPTIGLPLVKP
jgi:hypothetical protein